MALKARDTLGVTEEFTLYDEGDATVSADRFLKVRAATGGTKIVPLEVSTVASQRTSGSRLYYHDGTTKYRAAKTKWNTVSGTSLDGWFTYAGGIQLYAWFLGGNVSTCMVEDFSGNPITVTPPMVDPASRYLESDVATMLRLQVLATGVSDTTKSTIYWFPFSNSPFGDWVKVYDQIIPPSGIIDITNMTGITEVPGKPRGANGGFWGSVPFIVGGGGRMRSIITFPSGIA